MNHAASDDRPHVLIIGTGGKAYREYLLRSISSRYRIHLLLGAEPTWEADYFTGCTVLEHFEETIDAEEMTSVAKEVTAADPLHGVLSWDEARVLQVAKVAGALGLPGGDPDVAMRCRDKHLTRQALDAAGVRQPRSVLVEDLDGALGAAGEIGYPVVLKPRAKAASLGVVRVDSADELQAHFAFAHDTTIPGAWHYDLDVLVEEYVSGPEISVDSAIHRGEVFPLCVARKVVGYPPYFEEVAHGVNGADPLLADPQMLGFLQRVHQALGFTDGITHTEIKLTPDGPSVVEVNGRLGGCLIPYLGLRVRGIDPGFAAAEVACGRPPQVAADRSLVGAVRFFYPEADDTTIGSLGFTGQARTPATDLLGLLRAPGDTVSPPPKGNVFDRVGYVTAVAQTEQECLEALDTAEAAFFLRPAGADHHAALSSGES